MKKSKLVFLLLSILLLTSCGKGCQRTANLKGGDDPFNFIPPQNNFLISINWKNFITTPFFAEFTKEMPSEAKQLSSDLDQMLIALNIQDSTKPTSGLMVFKGQLNEKKVLPILEEDAKKEGKEVKKEIFENKTIYLSPKDPNIGLVFVSSSIALAGQIANLKEAILLFTKRGDSLSSNKELVDLFNHRDPNKLIWGGAIIPANAIPNPPKTAQIGNPMIANFQGLKTISFSMDYDKELRFDFIGIAQENAQIQNLVNILNSYKTVFGASLSAKDPTLAQAIQGIQISNQDKIIQLSLKLPEEVVQKLSKQLKEKKEKEVQEKK